MPPGTYRGVDYESSSFQDSALWVVNPNTVSTGAFTIPVMKKAGFEKHVAGGIEPAAALGGMLMPPIMGAGGFQRAIKLANKQFIFVPLAQREQYFAASWAL